MNDKIVSIAGGKDTVQPKKIPSHPYIIEDRNGEIYTHEGFLIFTSSHLAIMRDEGDGSIPIFVLPLDMLKVAELDEDEAPF